LSSLLSKRNRDSRPTSEKQQKGTRSQDRKKKLKNTRKTFQFKKDKKWKIYPSLSIRRKAMQKFHLPRSQNNSPRKKSTKSPLKKRQSRRKLSRMKDKRL
jgi:hypothetical protein